MQRYRQDVPKCKKNLGLVGCHQEEEIRVTSLILESFQETRDQVQVL